LSDQGRTAAIYHRLSSLWLCRNGVRPKGVRCARSRLCYPRLCRNRVRPKGNRFVTRLFGFVANASMRVRPKGNRFVTPANSRLDSPLYIHLKTAVRHTIVSLTEIPPTAVGGLFRANLHTRRFVT
jgi:hypothetical protein